MDKGHLIEAVRRTGMDVLQLAGATGAIFALDTILRVMGIGGTPLLVFVAMGIAGALIEPKVQIHGPLALVACVAAPIYGLANVLPLLPWIALFFLGGLGKHYSKASGDSRFEGIGLLAMIGACAGFFSAIGG